MILLTSARGVAIRGGIVLGTRGRGAFCANGRFLWNLIRDAVAACCTFLLVSAASASASAASMAGRSVDIPARSAADCDSMSEDSR